MSKRVPLSAPPEPRARGGRARSVAEIVPEIGRSAFRRFGFVQSSVVSRWAEIVGPRHAAHATPESIRFPAGKRADGVLTIVVAGAHAPMMQHATPIIIERVNRFFGYDAVARVVIRQGVLPPPPPRRAPLPSVAVAAELGDSLRTIADPELKAVLASLAAAVAAATAPPVAIPILGKVS